jgi:FkbM family methyltransferase
MFVRHLVLRSLKQRIRAVPSRARYWDGIRRPARYDLTRIFHQWRTVPELRTEADQSYNAYNGGDFIDIGAFVGFYAALLAPKARPGDRFVLCEPDSHAHPRLFAHAANVAAAFPNLSISVVTVPIGDGGMCKKMLPGDGPAAHYRFGASSNCTAQGIATTTVDQLIGLLSLNPTFIKIDVEGAEYNVLRGMRQVLKDYTPTIAIEIHPDWLPCGVTVPTVTNVLTAACFNRESMTSETGHTREIWQRDNKVRD